MRSSLCRFRVQAPAGPEALARGERAPRASARGRGGAERKRRRPAADADRPSARAPHAAPAPDADPGARGAGRAPGVDGRRDDRKLRRDDRPPPGRRAQLRRQRPPLRGAHGHGGALRDRRVRGGGQAGGGVRRLPGSVHGQRHDGGGADPLRRRPRRARGRRRPRAALAAQARVQAAAGSLVDAANAHCPRMVARGGGVRRVYARIVATPDGVAPRTTGAARRRPRSPGPGTRTTTGAARGSSPPVWMLAVMLDIDVCEAMGANKCNTVAEGVAPEIARIARGRAGPAHPHQPLPAAARRGRSSASRSSGWPGRARRARRSRGASWRPTSSPPRTRFGRPRTTRAS